MAIMGGYTDIPLVLLAAAADVHAKEFEEGWTALYWACNKGLDKAVGVQIELSG